jgi:hypothetical protein
MLVPATPRSFQNDHNLVRIHRPKGANKAGPEPLVTALLQDVTRLPLTFSQHVIEHTHENYEQDEYNEDDEIKKGDNDENIVDTYEDINEIDEDIELDAGLLAILDNLPAVAAARQLAGKMNNRRKFKRKLP